VWISVRGHFGVGIKSQLEQKAVEATLTRAKQKEPKASNGHDPL
jgi:hypothetical protein